MMHTIMLVAAVMTGWWWMERCSVRRERLAVKRYADWLAGCAEEEARLEAVRRDLSIIQGLARR